MTLLSIVQDACNEIGVTAPSTVIGNNNLVAKQMLALSNTSGKMLSQRFAWQELVRSATITTVATELQGLISTLLPGFNWYLYESMWNRDTRNKVWGPLFPEEWEFLKASNVTGPFPQFRIFNRSLYMMPAPVAGQTIGLEYVSKYWCESSSGAGQDRWQSDDDVGVLDEDLLKWDLIWRYESKKGLDYAEDFRTAEMAITNAMARNGGRRKSSLDGTNRSYPDGVFGLRVPDGSWNI